MPAVDLRELVKAPIELTGTFDAPKLPHPIHEGIRADRQYVSNSASPIALPRSGRGLERLKVMIQESVPGADPKRSLESYVKLLAAAPFHHTVRGSAETGPDGQALDAEVAARARSVLLTGVFRDAEETFVDHGFSSPRLAAVGILTAVSAVEDQRHIEDAWLTVEWAHSTRAMLEALLRVPGLNLEPPRVNRRIEILVEEGLATEHASLTEDIERLTMMLGGNPKVHVVVDEEWGKTASKVRANNPFELVALGATIHGGVISEFTRRHGEKNLHRANVTSAHAAMPWLLENLPHIMGLTPALMSFPQAEIVAGRPRMPVRRPVKCLHHGDNRYVLDADDDEWWTRDFAQHGTTDPTVFKTYALVDGDLLWCSDRDAEGQTIDNKHKGPEGKRIRLRETGSCGYPALHLH